MITDIRLHEVRIPLRFQFTQSNNPGSSTSLSMILAVQTADGITGYGECCPRTYVTGERPEDVAHDIGKVAAGVQSFPLSTIEDLEACLNKWEKSGIGPAVRCAFELAWLDAFSQSAGRRLPELLGARLPDQLVYSLVLPLVSPTRLVGLLERIPFLQPAAIKIKIDNRQAENLAKLRVIQDFFGADIPVRTDVNGGWTPDEAAAFIPQWLDSGVHSFEQPLAPSDYGGLAGLTARFGMDARIMADESLLDHASAETLISSKSVNHFNLKISKLGGIHAAYRIGQLAEAHGIPCQLGAHFGETSILSAAGILLAGMCPGLTAMEGALGEYLLEADICDPVVQHGRDGVLIPGACFSGAGLCGSVLGSRLGGVGGDHLGH